MSLGQLNISGLDRVQVAIERLRNFEPEEGYYLAFSGGKDSCVIKSLADMAGVKYDAHFNVTTVDPPEVLRFIREHHPDVVWEYPKRTMWQLIADNGMPPTRIFRYCCRALKEHGGAGRVVITGVRKAESVRRSLSRAGLELGRKHLFDPDNPSQELIHRCKEHNGKRILNPIIDWSNDDVWEFISAHHIPYCVLYDQGSNRIGCIGCPCSSKGEREKDFTRWPSYKRAYLRAFDKMLNARDKGKFRGDWKNAQDVFDWWMSA